MLICDVYKSGALEQDLDGEGSNEKRTLCAGEMATQTRAGGEAAGPTLTAAADLLGQITTSTQRRALVVRHNSFSPAFFLEVETCLEVLTCITKLHSA